MLVRAEDMPPPMASRYESESLPSSLADRIRRHLLDGTTGRVDILEEQQHRGVLLLSRGQVVWVHCDEHPEPFSQRLARDIGMSEQEFGHLLRTYPANKLDLVQVMAQNAPMGPVELREVLFEHSSAHLHALLRHYPSARAELHPTHVHFATPYQFDFDDLAEMGELTAAGDAISSMWDVLTSHPGVAQAWIMQEDVPADLAARWPWLEAGLGALRGDMPAFEWFGTIGDQAFVLLGEDPFVVVAALRGDASPGGLETIYGALTGVRSCLVGLALERVVRRIASAHPGGLLAARLFHEPSSRSATWHDPLLAEVLASDACYQAQAAEAFHEISTDILACGLGKGVHRTDRYDVHTRSRGGLSVVLLARAGSDVTF